MKYLTRRYASDSSEPIITMFNDLEHAERYYSIVEKEIMKKESFEFNEEFAGDATFVKGVANYDNEAICLIKLEKDNNDESVIERTKKIQEAIKALDYVKMDFITQYNSNRLDEVIKLLEELKDE